MILKNLTQRLNQVITENSGGTIGIRDEKLLLSALNRPFQTLTEETYIPWQLTNQLRFYKVLLLTNPF